MVKRNHISTEGVHPLKIIVLAFSLAGLVCSCNSRGGGESAGEPATTDSAAVRAELQKVSVMVVRRGDFKREVISNGKLAALNKADLRFRSAEVIKSVKVNNGDRVEKGAMIAGLDDFSLSGALNQAVIRYEKAKIDLRDMLMSLGFGNTDTSLIPDAAMRTALVRSGIEAAEGDVLTARRNLEASVICAPFRGIIANLFTRENNMSNPSERFCTVIDDSRFEAEFPVLESELPSVRKGQEVTIIPYTRENRKVTGRITKINPVVDQNGMVKISAVCNNENNELFEGMNVKVIIEDRTPGMLVIPKQAVVLRSEKQVVFTYKSGRAMWVYVKTGSENISSVVVTEGIMEGDSVIWEGNLNLAHESKVTLN